MSVRFGAFTFHPDRRQLLGDGVEIHLTPKAFDLLALLIERAPAVVSKQEIHKRLWPDTFVSDTTLVGLIKELRRALGGDRDSAFIRTAHRVGYAFCAPTDRDPAEPSADEHVAAPAATPWIVIETRTIPLREGVNVIGRDPDAAVHLDAVGVSRRHARIVVAQGLATLEDLGSKNGTLVGNEPVRGPVTLRNRDRIQIASELLVFHLPGGGISTATVPVSTSSPPDHS